MKIMVDASITSVGGGVQVALSFIENISLDPEFDVICVVNPQLDYQLSQKAKSSIQHYYVEQIVSMPFKFQQGCRLAEIEKNHEPEFVFVVFGPAYWRPKAKFLQGFALGKMLYQKELEMHFFEKCLNFIKAKLFSYSNSYLLVETELVKNKLASYLHYSKDKIFVIGNSFSPNFYNFVMKEGDKVYPSSDQFQLLVPGSYYPHKNLERIIAALMILKERIEKHSFKFRVLFTIPENSKEWLDLYNLAEIYDVESYITTAGFVENSKFANLYLNSNAVICASLVESSTAVFPEAFLSNKPLIVSDRLFATELCEDAALYFDPLDERAIAEAIWKIVVDKSLQKTLPDQGKEVLLKNYPSAESKWALQKKLIVELANK